MPDSDRQGHDAVLVQNGFVNKIKSVARRIPFAEDAVAAWLCTRDPATPSRVRFTLLAALAYFILPFDAVPDIVAGLGFTDDAAVLLAALKVVGGHITEAHRARARRWLQSIDLA
ncbi:MAG TPA: YkvA family protein [Vineibacter sp.]|nr:YkvA family protein [Vineibacter sp.]